MRIGIIGTGSVASGIEVLLAQAGHPVGFGSRDPAQKPDLPGQVGSIEEVASASEVLISAIPCGAWPQIAKMISPHVLGKVVIDAANPYPERDGAFARTAIDKGDGSGEPVARLLPDAKLVRAFNTVPWPQIAREANRPGDRIAIPLAGDDRSARETAADLIDDAGFQPVDAGSLIDARRFDPGTAAYNDPMPERAMRRALGLS